MIIDVHERRPDGSPGSLFASVERDPKWSKRTRSNWIEFAGEDYPVLTGLRDFIVVPAEKLAHVRHIMAVPLRTRQKRKTT